MTNYIERLGVIVVGTNNDPLITLMADNAGKSIRKSGHCALNEAIARIVAEEVSKAVAEAVAQQPSFIPGHFMCRKCGYIISATDDHAKEISNNRTVCPNHDSCGGSLEPRTWADEVAGKQHVIDRLQSEIRLLEAVIDGRKELAATDHAERMI